MWQQAGTIYTKISQWSDSICKTLVEPFFRWMFFGSFLLTLISNSNSIQSISWKVWSDFSFAYVSFHSPNKIISLNFTRELLETTWAGRATTTSSDGRILLGIAMVQSLWDTLTFTAIQAAKIPLQSGPQKKHIEGCQWEKRSCLKIPGISSNSCHIQYTSNFTALILTNFCHVFASQNHENYKFWPFQWAFSQGFF